MDLIDALCIVASSYNARSAEEERVYTMARNVVENHADKVMDTYRLEASRKNTDLFDVLGILSSELRKQ